MSEVTAMVEGRTAKGPHAFDFIYGRWTVHNRKLRDVTDPTCTEWVDFEATQRSLSGPRRVGHVDRMYVPAPQDGAAFEGLTLRLFDPVAETWSIWWSSTRAPGHLDPPMVGRFTGDHGAFYRDDSIGGRAVKVRLDWRCPDALPPTWQQSFSYDAGTTWKLNREMVLSRDSQT